MDKMRLIDFEQAKRATYEEVFWSESEQAVVRNFLAKLPKVDAVEVVHGRWIYHECVSSHDGAISGYSCSECNAFVNEEIFDMDEFHKDFELTWRNV